MYTVKARDVRIPVPHMHVLCKINFTLMLKAIFGNTEHKAERRKLESPEETQADAGLEQDSGSNPGADTLLYHAE